MQDSIAPGSSIGKLATWVVTTALSDGWQVTAVCRDLDPGLASDVRHLPLIIPPRSHLVQYAAGRTMARLRTRGGRQDVIFTHLPQMAARADLWYTAFLESAAAQATPRPGAARSVPEHLRQWSQAAVCRLEDHYLRQVGDRTEVLWCSELLEQEFLRLYGPPPRSRVLHNPALGPITAVSPAARARARAKYALGDEVLVAAYLGGLDPRKGYARVLAAAQEDPRMRILFAGPASDQLAPAARAAGAVIPLGHLSDLDDVLDAADALVMPSLFEPFGLVAVEAASRGTPVIVSPRAGVTPLVERHDAGLVWHDEPLATLLETARRYRDRFGAGGHRLASAISSERQGAILLDALQGAAQRNKRRS